MEKIIREIQEKIGKLEKDQKVAFGSTRYQYFNLEQLTDKLFPILDGEGLVLYQPMTVREGRTILQTIISDGDKFNLKCEMVLPDGVKPQDLGSAITYYRRYSIVSLLGLQAEDDDGRAASAPSKPSVTQALKKDLPF